MKVLLWHGYLLGGTGSNVYTRALARAWSRLGHEVVVFCQEPHPERYDLGGATGRPARAGRRAAAGLRARPLRGRRGALLQDLSWDERRDFVERNAAAVREHLPADLLLVEPRAARRAGRRRGGRAVRRQGARLGARVLHPRQRAARRLGARVARRGGGRPRRLGAHPRRARGGRRARATTWSASSVVPPGVDVEELVPAEPRDQALAALLEEAARDPPNPGRAGERLPDPGNAERLEAFLAGDAPTVVYVGKLSDEKGVALLLEALDRVPRRAR